MAHHTVDYTKRAHAGCKRGLQKQKHRELATYLLVIKRIRLDSVKRMTKIQNTS